MKRYKKNKKQNTVNRRKRTDKLTNKIIIKNKINDFKNRVSNKREASSIDIVIGNSFEVDGENLQSTKFKKLSNDKKTTYDTKLAAWAGDHRTP